MERQFSDLTASELFCSRCNTSRPVEERLLRETAQERVVEYCCIRCHLVLGEHRSTLPSRSDRVMDAVTNFFRRPKGHRRGTK